MAQYIDKSALVAEIDDMLKTKEQTSHLNNEAFNSGRWKALKKIKDLINTLEEEPVSEDLEKEIQRYYNEMDGDCRYMQTARHFARWQKQQLIANSVEAVIHPYDGEIWVDKDLLSIYDDCQRVKLIIIKENKL